MDKKVPTHLFHAQIDDMYTGVMEAENPEPQVVVLKSESFDILKDGKPHTIVLREMPEGEWPSEGRH